MIKRQATVLMALYALGFCVLATVGTSIARADTCNGFTRNLLTNCGFETGSFSGWTGTATTASSNYAGVDTGDPFTTFPTPYNGRYEAYLGYPGGTITLSQTVATIAGAPYFVEFALLNDTAPSLGYTNSLLATFGTGGYSLTGINAGAYTLYAFSALATSASTNLSFTSRNDGGYFELDSVSVVQTPEPATLTLLGSGVAGLAGAALRRRRFR